LETELQSAVAKCRMLLHATVNSPALLRAIAGEGSWRLIVIFRMYFVARRAHSHMARLCASVLRTIIGARTRSIDLAIMCRLANVPERRSEVLTFAPGNGGGVALRFVPESCESENYHDWNAAAEAVVDVLSKSQRGAVFVLCLQDFVRMRRARMISPRSAPVRRKIVLRGLSYVDEWPAFCAELVAFMANELGPSVLQGRVQIVSCLRTLIESLAAAYGLAAESRTEKDDALTSVELLSLCLQLLVGVLYASIENENSRSDDESERSSDAEASFHGHLRALLPTLEGLYKKFQSEAMPEVASLVSASVEFIVSNSTERTEPSPPSAHDVDSRTDRKHKLSADGEKSDMHGAETETDTTRSRLNLGLADTRNALIPVRAHGLAVITRIVLGRDTPAAETKTEAFSIVQERYDEILSAFTLTLRDTESYVYLAAVKGLVALADRFTERTLKKLFEEIRPRATRIGDDLRWLNYKLRLLEVLGKIAQRLGKTLPLYADRFAATLSACATLFPTKSQSENRDVVAIAGMIRASSIGTLGIVCKTLMLRSVPNLPQIFRMCRNAIRPAVEPNSRVRRAAACLLHELLMEREPSEFIFVYDDMRGLDSTLKISESSDPDYLTRQHASAAALEFDRIAKGIVFGGMSSEPPTKTLSEERPGVFRIKIE